MILDPEMREMSAQAENVTVYCLAFAGSERHARMKSRFDAVKVPCVFVEPISEEGVRTEIMAVARSRDLEVPSGYPFWITAIMQSHLKMIRAFVEGSSGAHGVFCEDDLHLRRSLAADLPKMVAAFERLSLDVLLLGYLLPHEELPAASSFTFRDYADDLWGAQMYMLSRSHAAALLDTYDLAKALEHPSNVPFASDWTVTKQGRRSRVIPMLAVEEGGTTATDVGQIAFHRRCFEAQYDGNYYKGTADSAAW